MRVQTMVVGLLQAALLMACERPGDIPESSSKAVDAVGRPSSAARDEAEAISLGSVGERQAAARSGTGPKSSGPARSNSTPPPG